MARRLGDSALLDLIGELVGTLSLEELRPAMLDAVERAVPADWISMNELGPGFHWALVKPEMEQHWHDLFAELGHENPLYQRWVRTRDGRAYRFSDVTTREELEATRLYQDFYRRLGVRHQMSVTLPNDPDRVLAVVLSRKRRDFPDAERDFLNRARPFLIQAYRNAVAHARASRSSHESLVSGLIEAGLTAREAEVMSGVAMGGSNRDIARRLGVSDRTVQKHLERAFRKLRVADRSAAAARAWELAR